MVARDAASAGRQGHRARPCRIRRREDAGEGLQSTGMTRRPVPTGRRDGTDTGPMSEEPKVRVSVVFQGHVQGVGFRYTTRFIASGYPITGYVYNSWDGTVHMVAEGTKASVSEMIQSVVSRMAGCVTSHEAEWTPATGEFSTFEIRREDR